MFYTYDIIIKSINYGGTMVNDENIPIYHFKGNINLLNEDKDEDLNIESISNLVALAMRSKNLCLFLGSGCSLNEIPLLGNTMREILSNPDNEDIAAYVDKFDGLDASKKFRDIEMFLNWLTNGLNFEKDESSRIEIQNILDKTKLELIKTIKTINDQCYIESKTLSNYVSFYNKVFSKRTINDEKISIFTTNYDLFNEYALSYTGIRYTTGFTTDILSSFDINQFKYRFVDDTNRYKDKWHPEGKEANLYKLHGSISWTLDKLGNLTESNKENNKVIIYPTELKDTETSKSPFSILFREFANQLQKPSTTLIVIGYGFPDRHINDVIAQNLKNDDFNLIVFSDIKESNVNKFYNDNSHRKNIHLIGGDLEFDGKTQKLHYFEVINNTILQDLDTVKIEGVSNTDIKSKDYLELEFGVANE